MKVCIALLTSDLGCDTVTRSLTPARNSRRVGASEPFIGPELWPRARSCQPMGAELAAGRPGAELVSTRAPADARGARLPALPLAD